MVFLFIAKALTLAQKTAPRFLHQFELHENAAG